MGARRNVVRRLYLQVWTVDLDCTGGAVGANVTAAVAIEGEFTTAPVVRRFQ